jgi:hypothetical protein
MTKKKLIEWLSRIGDDNTKIFFWNPGSAGVLEVQGADWNDRDQTELLIVFGKGKGDKRKFLKFFLYNS